MKKLVFVGSAALVAAWCGVTYLQKYMLTEGQLSLKGAKASFGVCAAKAFAPAASKYDMVIWYKGGKPSISTIRKADEAILEYSFATRKTTTPMAINERELQQLHISFWSDPLLEASTDGVHDCYYDTYKRRDLTLELWHKLGWQGKVEL